MAQIFAPGVAQVRVVGTVGVNPQAQVLHFYGGTTSAWSQAQINTLATETFTSLQQNLVQMMSSHVTYAYAEAIDLSDAVERIAKTTAASYVGGQTAPFLPLSACFLVSHKIGSRYRGGHPRTYFPGGSAGQTPDGDAWASATVASFQSGYNNFIDAILAALVAGGLGGVKQCAPRYTYSYTADATKHKFVKERTGYIGPFPISQSIVSSQIATQRRRLGP